jgi:hypothetical protein
MIVPYANIGIEKYMKIYNTASSSNAGKNVKHIKNVI